MWLGEIHLPVAVHDAKAVGVAVGRQADLAPCSRQSTLASGAKFFLGDIRRRCRRRARRARRESCAPGCHDRPARDRDNLRRSRAARHTRCATILRRPFRARYVEVHKFAQPREISRAPDRSLQICARRGREGNAEAPGFALPHTGLPRALRYRCVTSGSAGPPSGPENFSP